MSETAKECIVRLRRDVCWKRNFVFPKIDENSSPNTQATIGVRMLKGDSFFGKYVEIPLSDFTMLINIFEMFDASCVRLILLFIGNMWSRGPGPHGLVPGTS